jgi:hypothetical protein
VSLWAFHVDRELAVYWDEFGQAVCRVRSVESVGFNLALGE